MGRAKAVLLASVPFTQLESVLSSTTFVDDRCPISRAPDNSHRRGICFAPPIEPIFPEKA